MKTVAPHVAFFIGGEFGEGQISSPGKLSMGWIPLIVKNGFKEIWRFAHFT